MAAVRAESRAWMALSHGAFNPHWRTEGVARPRAKRTPCGRARARVKILGLGGREWARRQRAGALALPVLALAADGPLADRGVAGPPRG